QPRVGVSHAHRDTFVQRQHELDLRIVLQNVHEALFGGARVTEDVLYSIGDQLLQQRALGRHSRHVLSVSTQGSVIIAQGPCRVAAPRVAHMVRSTQRRRFPSRLWAVVVLLRLLWIGGVTLNVAGGLVPLLLVI